MNSVFSNCTVDLIQNKNILELDRKESLKLLKLLEEKQCEVFFKLSKFTT
jgi:hypothetical protein